jgi:hypothetical protein
MWKYGALAINIGGRVIEGGGGSTSTRKYKNSPREILSRTCVMWTRLRLNLGLRGGKPEWSKDVKCILKSMEALCSEEAEVGLQYVEDNAITVKLKECSQCVNVEITVGGTLSYDARSKKC